MRRMRLHWLTSGEMKTSFLVEADNASNGVLGAQHVRTNLAKVQAIVAAVLPCAELSGDANYN